MIFRYIGKKPESLLLEKWKFLGTVMYKAQNSYGLTYMWLPEIDINYLYRSVLDAIKDSLVLHNYFLTGHYGRYEIHVHLFYNNSTPQVLIFNYVPITIVDNNFEKSIQSFIYKINVRDRGLLGKNIPLIGAKIYIVYFVPKPPYWLVGLIGGSLLLAAIIGLQSSSFVFLFNIDYYLFGLTQAANNATQ